LNITINCYCILIGWYDIDTMLPVYACVPSTPGRTPYILSYLGRLDAETTGAGWVLEISLISRHVSVFWCLAAGQLFRLAFMHG